MTGGLQMEEKYFDFSTWPEGANMVNELFTFLPNDDKVRTNFLEGFAMILLSM